ncbi:hypothetical protein [Streptomyces sp. NBC_01465]|uniref:hypothetical protein n=1 Tax=Streptomyces sp. NBC_01465 TaxID=2903878 RepID=UPI002E30ACF2|nr:hypothetical protein [Streptomyces sp. NBC_01465]
MRVLISPSYGNAETRRHWADTIAQHVSFTDKRYDEVLSPEQRVQLTELHPEGAARFWGATSSHDKRMRGVSTGDVVLFTGENRVRAVGEVGAIFRNQELADRLWPPSKDGKSWHTVYTLLDLADVAFSYTDLNLAIGYKPAHNFPGQMVLTDEKARSVLEEFMITPGAAWTRQPLEPPAPARHGERAPQAVRSAALEEMRTRRTAYQRSRRLIVVDRHESSLVGEFRRYLAAAGRRATRFYCPGGISDLYISDGSGAELIEAKSNPGHRYVRQALGQLLDYAPHSPQGTDRLSALFPERPADGDVALLHRYGVDCLYRVGPGVFGKTSASDERRNQMREIWSGSAAS